MSDKLKELLERLERHEEHLSYSSLKAFRQSPRHFLRYKLKEDEQTKAMDEGSVIDILLTEPDKLDRKVLVLTPDCALNSWKGVQAYCRELGIDVTEDKLDAQKLIVNHALSESGKIVIDEATFSKCQNVVEKVRTNDASRDFFDAEFNEFQSAIEFELLGWKFRGIRDVYNPEIWVADGKKMADVSPKKAKRTIQQMWYDGQAAIYTMKDKLPYFIVAYDMSGNVSVTEIKRASIEMACEEVFRVVEKLEECIFYNYWHKSYDFWAFSGSGIFQY